MKQTIYSLFLVLVLSCNKMEKNSQGENFLNEVDQVAATIQDDSQLLTFFKQAKNPLTPTFENLPQGSVMPGGWMLSLMENDLNKGMIGALDELYPGIKNDDLYRTNRRGGMDDIPEMGDLILTGEARVMNGWQVP